MKGVNGSVRAFLAACCGLIVAAGAAEGFVNETGAGSKSYVLRWASSGGGWRSMISNMGYANIFAQAGIIDPVRGRCNFTAASFNSGGTWFATQFFYSPMFFEKVIDVNATAVREFVLDWLKSYKSMLIKNRRLRPFHSSLAFDFESDSLREFVENCGSLSWAEFIEEMFRTASTDYGDPGFVNRRMTSENRVPTMKATDLFAQMALAASSRIDKRLQRSVDLNYIGFNKSDKILAVPLGVQYAVKANQTFFQFAVPKENLPLKTFWARGPRVLRYRDWSNFPLYPPSPNATFYAATIPSHSGTGVLAPPFRGDGPLVTQIAASSSAALSQYAASTPSLLAQYSSIKKYDKRTSGFLSRSIGLAAEFFIARFLYASRLTWDLAVCTQWPLKCDINDGRFLDGSFSDGPCTYHFPRLSVFVGWVV
jgi:hypothetical protein